MLESMKARKRVRAVPPMRRKMAHEIKWLKTDIPDVLGQRPDIDDLDWSECRDMGYKTIDSRSDVDMSHRPPFMNPVRYKQVLMKVMAPAAAGRVAILAEHWKE